MKCRNAYEKPSERRNREKAEAIRRARKAARKQAQREGLIPSAKRRQDTPRPAGRPRSFVPGCALGESESPRPRATLLRPKKLDHASRGWVRAINCSSRAQWKTLTNKSPKTRMDLQALVLARLRAAPQCGGASHVTVVPYDDYRVPASWEVASLDLSTSNWEKCERALIRGLSLPVV